MTKQSVIVTWFYIPHVCDYLVPPMRKKRLLKIQKCPTQTIALFGNWLLPFVVTFRMFKSSPVPHFWKANIVIVTQCHPPLTTLDWLCMINFSKDLLQLGSTESTNGSNRVKGLILKLSFCHGYRARCHFISQYQYILGKRGKPTTNIWIDITSLKINE